MRHSVEMLEGAKKGLEVVVLPSDDLEMLEEVTKSFMQEEEFYDLAENIQEFVVGILASVYEIRASGGLEAMLAPAPPAQAVGPAMQGLAGGAQPPVPTRSGGPLADPNNPNPPIADGPETRGGTGGTY